MTGFSTKLGSYWGGWIFDAQQEKKELLAQEKKEEVSAAKLFWGLGLLGFCLLYREGF